MIGSAIRPSLALMAFVALFAMVPLFGDDYFVGVVLTLLMWIALTESWVVLCSYFENALCRTTRSHNHSPTANGCSKPTPATAAPR